MRRCILLIALVALVGSPAFGWDDDYPMIGKEKDWNIARPDMADLSVQFISRTPRYAGLQPVYTSIANDIEGEGDTTPITLKNPDAQRNPRPGQEVTFTAVVRNVGSRPVPAFDWAWLYDGHDAAAGVHSEPLGPDETIEFVYRRAWQDGAHHIAFQVDRRRLVDEISAENNWVIDRTDALSLAFFVEESVAAFFNTVQSGLNSFSFEDWAQFQIREMNREFRDSIYPTSPGGITERVRLDRVYRIPDGWGHLEGMHTPNVLLPVDLDNPSLVSGNDPPPGVQSENFNNMIGGVDGVWGFSDDLLVAKPEWGGKNFYQFQHRWLTGAEWPLHHELGHQLGRADHYLMPTSKEHNAAVPGLSYEPPADYRDGMMYSGNHAHDNNIGKHARKADSTYRYYNEHLAASFNRDKGVRRGLFGEYMLDVPTRNTFAFLGPDKKPLAAGATVELFVAKGRGYANPGFGEEPNYVGRTNAAGRYTLERSPWNHVFIWASNAVVLFRVTPAAGALPTAASSSVSDTATDSATLPPPAPLVGFLDISHFNLAHWRGHADDAHYTVLLKPAPPPPPASTDEQIPTGKTVPSATPEVTP